MLVVSLAAAATLAACGSVAAPKPDPAADAAFVTQLKQLCSKAAPLARIDASASMAAIAGAANANATTVTGLEAGLVNLTPSVSSASPLAPAITDLAQMLLDMSKWYGHIVTATKTDDARALRSMPEIAIARENQARSDLAKIGVTSCLS